MVVRALCCVPPPRNHHHPSCAQLPAAQSLSSASPPSVVQVSLTHDAGRPPARGAQEEQGAERRLSNRPHHTSIARDTVGHKEFLSQRDRTGDGGGTVEKALDSHAVHMPHTTHCCGIAQCVEHPAHTRKVAGSSPAPAILKQVARTVAPSVVLLHLRNHLSAELLAEMPGDPFGVPAIGQALGDAAGHGVGRGNRCDGHGGRAGERGWQPTAPTLQLPSQTL